MRIIWSGTASWSGRAARCTRDERRLLRVLAAAQAEAWDVLDACLSRYAPQRELRAGLASRTRTLAEILAVRDVWLVQRRAQPGCQPHSHQQRL